MISTEFPHDSPLHLPHAAIHFKSCFRHNINLYNIYFLRLIYICSKKISVLILELVACQFWLALTPYPQTSTPKQCRLRYFHWQTWRCTRNEWKCLACSLGGKVSGSRIDHVATAFIRLAYRKLASLSPFLSPKLKEHFWFCNLFAL